MGDLEKQIERQIDPGVIENRIDIKAESTSTTQVLIEDERASLENSAKREVIADIVAARAQRESYARRTFKVVVVWISLVYILLLAQAVVPTRFFHPFSDKLLIVLLTTTTANFIGMFVVVLKYIFRVPESPSK